MPTPHYFRQRTDLLFIILTGMIIFWANLNINGNKNYSKGLIESDARGYYAYLPAIFIYHDLNFHFFDTIEKSRYYNANLYYEYRAIHEGKTINKYFCGTALCLSPFFLAGHLFTQFTDLPRDGYSTFYVKSVALASVFYLLLSLFLMNAILIDFSINTRNRAFALLAMTFGTNLFYYNIAETCLSHVYSLTFFCLFILSALRFFRLPSTRYFLLLAVSLGMIVLIRPVNVMILLAFPFLAGNTSTLIKAWHWVRSRPLALLSSLLCLLAIVSIQLIIYKIQTGYWVLYSYKGEGFNFLHPRMIPILFSYKKGLFLYTPVYLVSMTGLFFLFKSDQFRFWAWTGFFLIILYVISSWENWYYGGSFSGRVFIEYLPFFILLLAITLQGLRKRIYKTLYIAVILGMVVICQLQTYQYRRGQIHWSDQTKEKYWENFLGHKKLHQLFQ